MPSTRGQWNTNTFTPVPIPPLSSLEKKMINWKQTCCRKLVGNKILSLFCSAAAVFVFKEKTKMKQKYSSKPRQQNWSSKRWNCSKWRGLNSNCMIKSLSKRFYKKLKKGTKSFLITLFYSQNSENIHLFLNPNNCDCKPQSIIWLLNPLSQQNDCV